MKKIITLLLLTAFLLLSTNAFAFTRVNTYWDLNAVDGAFFQGDGTGAGADDGITTNFTELGYFAETRSTINALTGVVKDVGHGHIDELFTGAFPSDTERFGSRYTMTFAWDNLEGVVTSNDGNTIEAVYNTGTINFYVGWDTSLGYSYGNAALFGDSDLGSFTDGLKVATIEITSGSYELDLTGQGGSSYILNGKFTEILDDFWFTEDGEDLSDELLDKEWVMAYSAGDTDPQNTIIDDSDLTNIIVDSPHDSSIEVGIVPEPGTMVLLGFGLLSLAGIARRKQ